MLKLYLGCFGICRVVGLRGPFSNSAVYEGKLYVNATVYRHENDSRRFHASYYLVPYVRYYPVA